MTGVPTVEPHQAACQGKSLGATCGWDGREGTCRAGECCTLDYVHRLDNGAPRRTCTPCTTCVLPAAPLEALVLPDEASLAAAASPVEATATSLAAALTPAASVEAATSATATASPVSPSAKEGCACMQWWVVASVLAVVGLWLVVRRRRRRP